MRGHLSATFARADFPIGGDANRTMAVNAAILFDNVVFGPGPLGGELLSLAGKGPNTALRINQTDPARRRQPANPPEWAGDPDQQGDRNHRQGLGRLRPDACPAGGRASEPIHARPRQDASKTCLRHLHPRPGWGYIDPPKVDRQALSAAIREVTRSILKRNGEGEAADLLKRFIR